MVSYCNYLKYQIKGKSLAFCCSGLEEDDQSDKNNNAVGELLDRFLLELSGDRKIYFHGYRLPSADEGVLIDPEVILERAEVLMNPFESFLRLERGEGQKHLFRTGLRDGYLLFQSKGEMDGFSGIHLSDAAHEAGGGGNTGCPFFLRRAWRRIPF